MKKILVSLFLGFLLMVFASRDMYAEPHGPVGNMGRDFQEEGMPMMPSMKDHGMRNIAGMSEAEHPMWKHLMNCDLNEKQKAEVNGIRTKVMKEMIKNRADEQVAFIELRELLDKDPVNMQAVEAKLKQIETLKTEMQLSIIRAIEETKSKLTPEQRKKFKEMRKIAPNIGPPMMEGMMRGDMRMPLPQLGE